MAGGLPGKARPPLCSDCLTREHMKTDMDGKWYCLKCADEWLKEFVRAKGGGHTKSGIILPSGVTDPAKENPSFLDVMPNRATRRYHAKISRRKR